MMIASAAKNTEKIIESTLIPTPKRSFAKTFSTQCGRRKKRHVPAKSAANKSHPSMALSFIGEPLEYSLKNWFQYLEDKLRRFGIPGGKRRDGVVGSLNLMGFAVYFALYGRHSITIFCHGDFAFDIGVFRHIESRGAVALCLDP